MTPLFCVLSLYLPDKLKENYKQSFNKQTRFSHACNNQGLTTDTILINSRMKEHCLGFKALP